MIFPLIAFLTSFFLSVSSNVCKHWNKYSKYLSVVIQGYFTAHKVLSQKINGFWCTALLLLLQQSGKELLFSFFSQN